MKTYYEKWMQQEKDWIKVIDKERKRNTYLYAAIAVIVSVAALFGIGLLAGGIQIGIANIKYGLILGAFGGGLTLLLMLSSNVEKNYIKRLEKEVSGEIKSVAEREEFARSLLEKEASGECLEYVQQKGAVPERFCAALDYALCRGMIPCLVRLDKTEKIEVDVVQSVNTIRAGDYKIRVNYSTYPIYVYYRKPQSETGKDKKTKIDKVLIFPSKELRNKAAGMMRSCRLEEVETEE